MTPLPAFVRRRGPGMLAALAVTLLIAGAILGLGKTTEPLRERLFDAMIGPRAGNVSDRLWVVEIGAANENGAPWSRGDLARLISVLAAAKPAAIGLDIVLSQGCEPSADTIALAAAIAAAPVVTGFVLPGPVGNLPHPQTDIAAMQSAPAWDASGAETACDAFQIGASGAALISLSGGRDGRIRTAPAAAFVAGQPFLGMGVDLARRSADWPTPILGGADAGWLRLGDVTIPLEGAGQFRFVPTDPTLRAKQTLDAATVLAGQLPLFKAGAIVLIGSTLPEKGGLRASRVSPLHPSLHLQADVVEQLLSQAPFWRGPNAPLVEAAVALLGGALAVICTLVFSPGRAALLALMGAVTWSAVAAATAVWGNRLLDPLLPALAIIAASLAALLAEARASKRAEGHLSARMRQHLPASLVDRVTDGSAPLHLKGEMREITALFTDIEGFSDLTRRLPPQDLVDLLDRYFTGLTLIIGKHGGMIDKIVGDAVHAFFNAPLDQPDHVNQAIATAAAIRDFAAGFAADVAAQKVGFGRTRIGVETGMALLGDVGQGGRTDYTAHGDAVNMAARLQEASKTLGITVLIGPRAAQLTAHKLGQPRLIELRSFGAVMVRSLADPSAA